MVYVLNRFATDDVHKAMQVTHASSGASAVPCFYSEVGARNMAIIGKGGNSKATWSDLEVEMSAPCDAVIQRVYCSKAPTGRCFCCQYIVNLHEEIHSGRKHTEEETSKVKLCKKFQQNTKRRGD